MSPAYWKGVNYINVLIFTILKELKCCIIGTGARGELPFRFKNHRGIVIFS